MFFNIYVYRITNPYNTEGWDCKSQPQASPFSYLIKDKSGRTDLLFERCPSAFKLRMQNKTNRNIKYFFMELVL